MVKNNLLTFCKRNTKYKQRFSPPEIFENLKQDVILEILCEFLMQPECTKDVAECFSEFLPALISMAIPADNIQSSSLLNKDITHRLNCVILGKLININPDLLVFVLCYFDVNPSPFELPAETYLDLTVPIKRQNTRRLSYIVSEVSEYDIVTACHNILCSAIKHFKYKWNWFKFYKYLTNTDNRIKWVALKCLATVLDMSHSTRLLCAQKFIPNLKKFLIDYEDSSIDISTSINISTDVSIACASFESIEDAVKNISSIISVAGVLLPTLSKIKNTDNLVLVSSTRKNLQNLAMAIGSRKCICLQGPIGCGKTALVEYLAKLTGRDSSSFVKVQLGDQTDSKMLLGMYRCTDVPGEFVWQPGVLTQAVVAGKWLLLEDIDSAGLDIASVLSNLMETGTLCVPGYRDTVHANSGFQLFVTQRLTMSVTGIQKHITGSSSLLQKHWLCLNVEPLSKDELIIVVQTLFPALSTIATKIIDVFLLFSVGDHDSNSNTNNTVLSLKIGRQTSTRDLVKWCSRAIVDFDVSSSESALKLFQDALDVFCSSVSDQAQRLSLAIAVANKLGIIKTKAEYFYNIHKPSITLLPEILVVGRAKISRKKIQYAKINKEKTHFSFTRSSSCLLERIASCVMQKEPVLLVGETGVGKTSTVQYLAKYTGHKLTIINMNQQSESADLLGGYKPVDLKYLISPIREEFEILFRSYFVIESNKKFLEHIAKCYKQQKWKNLVTLMSHSARAAVKRLKNKFEDIENNMLKKDAAQYSKQNKISCIDHDKKLDTDMLMKWERMLKKLNKLDTQVKNQHALTFSFIEGSLIKALRNGYWVLLDEINLANAETLECLSGLLEGSSESLLLLEHGIGESVKRHPDFMMFACMNPATDVGKKDLPVGLRNRFTEFYIDELIERSDLELLVQTYLAELNLAPEKHEAIVKFYLNIRKEATNVLFDGTAHKPHYSLRTLCRALYISASNPCGSILRSLYEAFSLSFLTQLNYDSYPIVQKMIAKAILDKKNVKAICGMAIPKPKCGPKDEYVYVEGYWILQGSLIPITPSNYILTDSIKRNLKDLVRVVSIGKIPVLLQGDTSVGKTSLITYLAKITGHVCVRINNHEHTDLQEYVGNYIADETGKLVFQEGILVNAMRKGHWVILDELNLAPSDVLEALNRVLDDNRELFIPETQQVVKAHERFMLFATQNPPGLYGGRKVLSRAFRNRFVELHFDEIPPNELQMILNKRCNMPESYCKQIINVMTDLQVRRKGTAAFAGKRGFVTLRDLFRWGERYRLVPDIDNKLYDWNQHLADEGYLVLAAKVRKSEEANEIREVIKKHLKRDVNPDSLFTLNDKTSPVTRHILETILNNSISRFGHIVWTYHMRRMAVLVKKSCQFKEPVLLVGETGGGKTTVCQLIAAINGQAMRSVNCHMHTESSDFLGNLRPVREHTESDQRLFEWVDGPLINAMRNGDLFLADEISLADDSVLERLNSLLEPERSLLLTEKVIESSQDKENTVIVANEKFVFIGTMNPSGDFGKKELSPALRNRFTEIWCEGCTVRSDLQDIIVHNLCIDSQTTKESVAIAILRFIEWLQTTEVGKKLTVSIRDILTWVNFINTCTSKVVLRKLTIEEAYYHGACLTYIDSLGSGATSSEKINKLKEFKEATIRFIKSEVKNTIKSELTAETSLIKKNVFVNETNIFGVPPFYIKKNSHVSNESHTFKFTTTTTKMNTLKLLRALKLNKPILLEGNPGVGKTSLVSALAKAVGHTLIRINLSDQTDVSDLFGADLPVEGGKSGEFAWRDGPFLRALRSGYWILLDELNLASQSVLEALNACFDHRGEVYIPELDKTFSVKSDTKLFGCQNPLGQGGDRRGLPKSFLNRFTQIFVDALIETDLKDILNKQFPELSMDIINTMVKFNNRLVSEVGVTWGHSGAPWEMNLRDIIRWCETTIKTAYELNDNSPYFNPSDSVELIYINRMRTYEDRQKIYHIYQEMVSLDKYPLPSNQLSMYITADELHIGDTRLSRKNYCEYEDCNLLVLRDQKSALKSLMQCVKMNWMSILVGVSGCGKSTVVRLLAALTGQKLRSIAMNSAMDTTEILGGFEQTDYNRHLEQLFERVATLLIDSLRTTLNIDELEQVAELHKGLIQVRRLFDENIVRTIDAETKLFLHKIEELSKLVMAMRQWEPSHELELSDIKSKLKNLSISVKQDKCLNAGGKFEWVDSVLVKCLQDGTWLLIDQVNLCSPAVLDRLNGLLEPNGVLSIGERGVDGDGNVVTIKPHENFRLFLTMDPRYGEISRAMRNRGVEIYMLDPKKNVDYDAIDLKSLVFNAGVVKSTHRDALLEIYDKMSDESVAVDRLSMIDLLHTAFLVKQRSLRGFSAKQLIRDSCIDVYINARPTRDPRLKEYFVSLIDQIIEQYTAHDNEISVIDLNAATWSLKNLHDNPIFTVMKQQGLLLNTAAKMYKLRGKLNIRNNEKDVISTKLLNDFCNLRENEEFVLNVDVAEILPYFLLNFYELSSQNDAPLRKEWLSKTLRGNTMFDELEKKSALMAKVITLFSFRSADRMRSSLPWDLWQLIGRTTGDKDDSSDTNKLLLLLYASSMILESGSAPTEAVRKKSVISVKQYSTVVLEGKILSQLKNQPLVTCFAQFLKRANSCIAAILRDSNVSTNPKEYVEARKELKWYTRFEKLGEMTLINKLEKSEAFFKNLEQISLLLKIHYKWLLKFLHKLFAIARKFPNEKIANEIEHLLDIVDNINDQLELVYDPMKKISKKIKKYLILPSPHSSETSMNVHLRLRTIAKDFSVRDESGNSLKRELKILFVQLKDSLMMRYQTIRLWCDIYSREPIGDTILRTILEVERFCDESHIRLRVPVEIENVLDKVYALPGTETAHLNAKIQLWPIYEYIFLSFAYKLQGEMCLQGTSSAAISTECLAKFADVPSIPINLISLLNVMARKEVERRQKTLLLPELFCRLEQFTRQSYAVKGASRLLHWRGITEKNLEKSLTLYSESKESYFGGPVLLNLVLKFMLRKTNEKKEKNIFSVVELGTYTAQINQLQLLNEILWRNSILLTDKRYDLSNSDLTTLRFYLHVYLAAIDKLHTEHNVPELIATAIKKQGGNLAADIENKLRIDYFEPLEELRKSRDEIEAINNENLIKEEIALRRGKAWMLLGYIQLQFFGNLDIIDPVHKVELKLRYVEEDIVDCRRTMYVTTLQNRILGRSSENRHAHPRFKAMRDFERQLLKTRNDLSCMNAFRPQSINFTSLSSDSSDFRHKVGSYELVKKHLSQLYAIASKIASEKYELADFKVAEIASREAESWSLSVQRFAEQIEEKYLSAYPDVILPLMAALAQVSHGVGILINEIQRLISLRKKRVTDLDSLIHNLIRFPTIDQQQESLLNLSDLCVARNIRNLINESSCSVDSFVKIQDQFRMLKSGLYELYNHVILNRGLTQLLWRDLNKLLQQIVLIWKQQQQEEEKRIAEKNNLYKNKIENHGNVLTEEEELTLEVREMFPTYRERDFYDIEDDLESSLDRKLKNASSEPDETQSSFSGLITKDDIREIQNIHSKIITSFTVSKWIRIDITSIPSTNYVEPLTQRYYIVHGMLDYILPSLSEDLAIKLYNSYSFLVTLGLQENRGTDRTLWKNIRKLERVYDFYKDSNVEEAKQCLPLCENILNRINQLLEQWPDHPTLRSIRCIIERMYTFSITSPVSRFLTGLELLLVKMHQWEENAHKGVSLSDYILALTEQIISWRKLELSCWKGCLDAAHETLKSDTSKWWFFLYALIESYITRFARDDIKKENDEPVTKQKLVESLERFMNESSLVEFESRLNFLLTFHCHVCYFDVSDDKNEILAILWNMYNYYKQFVDDVNTRIAALKAPIEKKLKDFVKIARWNDISYWAVKETVEKTHRTLHKFVKEFQKALKQNVSFCLAVKSESYSTEMSKGIWDDQDHRKYVIIPEDFIITKSSGTVKMEVLFTSGLITRTNMLLEKAKYLCKEIVLTSSYPFIRSELENLIGDFMEQSARLRNMDIDRSLPKGKQKSQAKSILQQKKLTLANYFKELLQLGVSYRTGVLILKNDMDKVIDFTISPLDLSVINQYFKLRNIDHHMLMQWQGCEKYYYKSLIKLNALNAMLSTCQTDLGLQNMERCRGFSAHMMLMAHRQKKTIIQSFECFSSLRIQISNLTETREEDLSMSKQRDGQDCTEILKTLLITLEAGFEQLLLFLQCCPVESSTDTNRTVLTLDINALPIIAACQNDEVWKNANTLLKDNLDLIKVTAKRFNILFMAFKVLSVNHSEHSVRTSFLSSKHFEFLEQCRVTIEVVRTRNKELKQLFENSDVAHPIQESIIFLDTKMECFLNKYKNLRKVVGSKNGEKQLKVNNDAVKQYELSLEQLINMILLVIQKKYKDHVNVNDEVTNVREKLNEENNENDNDMEEEIEKNRLSKKLIEFLEKDIIELKLSKIYDLFFSLLLSIHEFDLQSANYCIRLLLQCLPLLEQYIFLVQFYLNEQVAAFRITCKMLYLQLNVFLDLAANGFCNPKDLDLEEGETDESGEKIEKGGMGLADGEGTKNVSDRIESEDQLEDTKSAEQEQEKQDDKICKEEKKGIEMSEDFDSKPQDTEKGDDDKEQDNDENENDLDKEMGETGEGAEQLDKEIWDDDTESEENSEQNDNEEEGTSKQTDEKIIGAKDDRDKRKHDDDDTSENREENQKEINEMEESEVDEDQINPYHGKFDPLPEPEPLDLPEDMNLDEDGKEDNSNEEENPFDIDEMKNSKPPPEKKDETFEKEFEKNKENDFEEDCSEEENDNVEDINTNGQKTQEEPETNKETEENNRENAESETKNEEQQQDELEKEKLPEKAAPSVDDASKEIDAASQVEETIGGSRDTVAEQSDKDEQEASADNTQQNNNDKGTGQSQSAQQESGHSGSSKQEATPISQKNTTELMEKRKNLGEKNEDRSLLDWIEPALKKLKTTFTKDEIQRNKKEEDDSGNSNTIDLAQHIKDSEKFDDYTLDVATEDQAREQASNIEKEKENQDETKNDAMDIKMHDDEENITHDEVAKKELEVFEESETADNKRKEINGKCSNVNVANDSQPEETEEIEMELEERETMLVQRAPETTFHTMEWSLEDVESSHVENKRFEVEKMLSEWTQMPSTKEAAAAWNYLCSITDSAARDLSEKLRLVLEPTQFSRLKGDYKTGKRINMRKIIPYIASEFRKDKIWLRRTKASKRDYQIILALDDSRSMMNNQCKEMTFESLSLISKAMTYLEVGKLGIVSFGENVKVLHPLGETFTEQSGSRIIQEMRFNQELTRVAQLLDFTIDMFENQRASLDHAKLLVVLSDGRNVYADAINTVKRAVRRARLLDIFLVFVIIDNPNKKDSILDIVWPVFDGDQVVEFKSYMDFFPFPFYIHVRDMNTLPEVLSDALRQWFELVGKIDI